MKWLALIDGAARMRVTTSLFLAVMALMVPSANADDAKPLEWLTSREAGIRNAQLNKRPILIRFTAEYCVWCRKLEAELDKPDVKQELGKWTLVVLDTERASADARVLNVESIPALRVLSPMGRLLDSQDGYMPEDKLIGWLKKAYEQAIEAPEEILMTTGSPTPIEVRKIIRQFSERDSSIRESAIRRLIPYPSAAAESVVAAFKQEKLGVRLAALELLRDWQAPLDDLDPWQPETMTAERLLRIEEWVATITTGEHLPRPLSPSEKDEVLTELDHLLTTDLITATAIRERLARHRTAILPEVVARLMRAANDDQRARLLALRYRLVMPEATALTSPGLVDRLASIDVKIRHQAVRELTENATPETQPLFLELFADPDPFVRELSLLGLRSVAGDEGTNALATLLNDPELNVRAAVLKVFAENPWPGLQERLSEFLKNEKDTDLMVHAVRCFRTMPHRSSADLLPLLQHRDWQVRAEALDTLTGSWQQHPDDKTQKMMQEPDVQDAVTQRLQDDDPFVVSRAIRGIHSHLSKKVVQSLTKVPERHPSLLKDVVDVLSTATSFRKEALPQLKLYFHAPEPEVRSAAIHGLGSLAPNDSRTELLAALQDDSADVRIAGAKTLLSIFKRMQPTVQNGVLQYRNRNGIIGDEVDEESSSTVEDPQPQSETVPDDPDDAATDNKRDSTNKSTESVPQPQDDVAPATVQDVSNPKIVDPSDIPTKKLTRDPPTDGGNGFLGLIRNLFGGPKVSGEVDVIVGAPQSAKSDEVSEEKMATVGPKRDKWIEQFHSGKRRPEWTSTMIPLLEKMFASANLSERIASAAPLSALGKYSVVQPEFISLLKTAGRDGDDLIQVLNWLPFSERQPLVAEIASLPNVNDFLGDLVNGVAHISDARDADLLWNVADSRAADAHILSGIENDLKQMYFADKYYDLNSVAEGRKKRIYDIAHSHLSSPPGWRHIVALSLMYELLPKESSEEADQIKRAALAIADDESLEKGLRSDAFQIALAVNDEDERRSQLINLLSSSDRTRQLLALRALLDIHGGLSTLANSGIHLGFQSIRNRGFTGGAPHTPELPKGLTAQIVRPLTASDNDEIRAIANYVLAVSGDRTALPPLLTYWRSAKDGEWNRLVYRAIAATDDSSQIPVLKQIYKGMREWEINEFYWTIRIMTGPGVLELRNQIRKENASALR